MSLSRSPEYLAKRGVLAKGGPHDGKYLTDEASLDRCVAWRDETGTTGFYFLEGKADGGFRYVWCDMASFESRQT